MKSLLLLGYGAMGREVHKTLRDNRYARVKCVIERRERCEVLRQQLDGEVDVLSTVEGLANDFDLALECAGHDAVATYVPELLRRGIDTIIASVGALAEPGLPERLEHAALYGNAQLVLVPGAIAGIDALCAAKIRSIDTVSYTGRKPPRGWFGTPAEDRADLASIRDATVVFEGNAREAARLYPKNANVAAMIALAGIGMERTCVSLIADPNVTRNTHTVHVSGDFGQLDVTIAAETLPTNPKTSALAALSILRAVENRVGPVVM
ncbi:MAG TPA: aspartate dehydrogenase [Casimicrobiaceae bacterium]|nr:aspartate dehydrogenase [Casimicrobiaceae bacterium]